MPVAVIVGAVLMIVLVAVDVALMVGLFVANVLEARRSRLEAGVPDRR